MENLLFQLSDVYMEPTDHVEFLQLDQLLGQICMNRVAGIAYLNMKKIKELNVQKEFMNTLRSSYEFNLRKTERFLKHLKMISDILADCDFRYALLKGSLLTTKLYEKGCRTSNDIDILIEEEDISKCQDIFKKAGFVQGYYSQGKGITKATRMEIIRARMNYGETVPLLKMVDGELLEVDINFSVDFKPSGERNTVSELLGNRMLVEKDDIKFYSLDTYEFLIHLCCHLFKEATTYEWVLMNRDLQLYKFSDINVFLHEYGSAEFFKALSSKVKQYEVQKECYYTFLNSAVIFDKLNSLEGFKAMLEDIKPEDSSYVKQIVEPSQGKVYYYEDDFEQWFMKADRRNSLKEM